MTDFFQSNSYVQWIRELVRAMSGRLGAVGLFDATMEEPHALMAGIVDRVLREPGTPRMRSVMDAGNSLVIHALAGRYGIEPERILCTTGALSGVSIVLKTFLGPGAHVAIERPHLDTLVEIAASTGAEISFFERSLEGGDIDHARLHKAMRPQTRLVLLTNLHNPSGVHLREDDLAALDAALGDHPAKILVDEAYADFADPANGCTPAAARSPRFISVNSLSKVYGLGVLRCGWIVADAETTACLSPVHVLEEFGMSKLTHAAASLVLEDRSSFAQHTRNVLAQSRPLVEEWAESLRREDLLRGRIPEFGCMFFPEICGVADTRRFGAWLWREYGIAAAPGELFGRPGHIRMGFGRAPDTLMPVLRRLAEGLRLYRNGMSSRQMMEKR